MVPAKRPVVGIDKTVPNVKKYQKRSLEYKKLGTPTLQVPRRIACLAQL